MRLLADTSHEYGILLYSTIAGLLGYIIGEGVDPVHSKYYY